ncbi:MAG: hypothetical protein QOG87_3921 [Actinomycetota bacterium]|jgi:hypothetical protein
MTELGGPPGSFGSEDAKGFLAALFDFSFTSLITTKIIKVVYVIFVIFSGLGALALFASLAAAGGAGAVVGLILAPIIFLVYVIFARMWLELVIIFFRIAENTERTNQLLERGSGGA